MCVCACVRAYVRTCVRACVRACVCVDGCMYVWMYLRTPATDDLSRHRFQMRFLFAGALTAKTPIPHRPRIPRIDKYLDSWLNRTQFVKILIDSHSL